MITPRRDAERRVSQIVDVSCSVPDWGQDVGVRGQHWGRAEKIALGPAVGGCEVRSKWRSGVLRNVFAGNLFDEIDDAATQLRIGDSHEGLGQGEAVGRGEKIGDVGRRERVVGATLGASAG